MPLPKQNILPSNPNVYYELYPIECVPKWKKQRLNSYWPSDDNDDTDEDLQKDPPEALLDDNYPHKTYTYVSF